MLIPKPNPKYIYIFFHITVFSNMFFFNFTEEMSILVALK